MTKTHMAAAEPAGPFSDTVHPFAEPDAARVAVGVAEADRCDDCGEHEEHWKHHVPDPALGPDGSQRD